MGPRRIALILSAALLAHCSSGSVIHLTLPSQADDHSAIVAFEVEEPGFGFKLDRLVAVDLDAPAPKADLADFPAYDGMRRLRFTVLLYADTLSTLAFDAGPVPLAAESEARYRSVPPLSSAFVRTIIGDDAGQWAKTSSLSRPIEAAHLSSAVLKQRVCDTFVPQTVVIETTPPIGDSAFAIEVQGGVLVSDGNRLTRVALDGSTGLVDSNPSGKMLTAAFQDPMDPTPGTIWFGGANGELWRGVLANEHQLDLMLVTSTTSVKRIAWMSGGRKKDGGLEIYTLGYDDVRDPMDAMRSNAPAFFARYAVADRAWTKIAADLPAYHGAYPPKGGVSWIGPEEVLAVYASVPYALHVSSGAVLEESAPAAVAPLTALEIVPGFGTVVADGAGELYRDKSGVFEKFADWGLGLPFEVGAILPYRSGFVVAGRNSIFQQYDAQYGLCDSVIAGVDNVDIIARLGEKILLAPEWDPNGRRLVVTIITVRPAAGRAMR